MIQCTLIFDKYEHNVYALINIDVIKYAFINEKIAQLICEKFQINFVILFQFKFVNEFEDRLIKSIIHVVYFTFTIQNHSKIIMFMFIIKINVHFLILNKFKINVHEIILNMKNDKNIFKFDRCIYSKKIEKLKIKNERRSSIKNIYLS